jgi:hypothetical protein
MNDTSYKKVALVGRDEFLIKNDFKKNSVV